MFCPKCGSIIEEGSVCSNCGLDMATIPQKNVAVSERTNYETKSVRPRKKDVSVVRYIYFALAAIVLIMFFIAAGSIISGGNEIMQIQSVGGKTLEEAYYQELGAVYAGYAMAVRAFGVFFSSVLVWLGLEK